MNQMKVALHTLGCKLNYSESSAISSQFLAKGYEVVDPKEQAEIYVINTCTVTENAERECRQMVRRFLRQNPEAFIIVTGCYAQLRPNEISSIKGVSAVLGSSEKFNIFSLLENFEKKELACVFVSPIEDQKEFGHAHSSEADSRTRAYLKIQDGCDYNCSFCTIPLARGRSRSMKPDEAAAEFISLIEQGYKEIILTGVNVGDYGRTFGSNLFQLLKKLVKINGDFRIRVSSIEPNLVSEEIINLVAENKKLCRHFHIPLQSGSPKVLKAMQRRYKASDYERLIHKIKQQIPQACIGADVIVGFPGESDEDFLSTHNLLRDLPISYLHVFTYSERPQTKAAEMNNKVDVFVRRERNTILRLLGNKKRNEFYNQMIGQKLEVLFEHENKDGKMKGFSSNYVRVVHDFDYDFTNKLVEVRIKDVNNEICTCEIIDTKKAVDIMVN